MAANPETPARGRRLARQARSRRLGRVLKFAAAVAAFPLAAFYLPPVLLLRSGADHALFDLAIALIAWFCALLAILRYQSRPQPLFLWMGAGLIASGLLDALHAMSSRDGGLAVPEAALDLGTWTWTASTILLAASIAIGLGRAGARRVRMEQLVVWGGAGAALLAVVSGALWLPRPAGLGVLLSHRPYEFLAAIFVAAAAFVLWRRYADLDATLRRRLGLALATYLGLHAGVMAWSAAPLDMFVALAHVAKLAAHGFVLLGLLQSSADLLIAAENAGQQLAAQTEEIEARERQIRTIVNHAPYAILTADDQGRIRDINPVAEKLFLVTRERAAGRPLSDFFDPEVREALEAAIGPGEHATRARLLQERQSRSDDERDRSRRALSREARGLRPGGEQFPCALTLTDAIAGGHRFFIAFVRDLTRTVQQEQRIQQALSLTTRILDHTSVAIYSTDPAGMVTRFNRTAQQWLGYEEREVVGRLTPAAFHDRTELERHAALLSREYEVPLTTDVEILLALARRGVAEHREWTLVRKDGGRFPASVSVVPLATEDGSLHGFVLVATDLSHQKEVEQLKNEFVSTVSHELRTPLTSVRGSLGLLAGGLAGKLPPQAQSLLEIAQRNTERLILLINDILDIEKIEAGKMRFNLKSLDLDVLVGEALQTAEGLAATRKVRLARRAAAPGLRVHADEQRLMQVLTNLLSNAIKFSPEGGMVEVDVEQLEGRARVSVTDHGAGIPEASQPRIFQKFFQADSSSSRETGGTGLGLSICKALVERMDGRMGFRSRPGETVFHFELPVDAGARAGEAAPRVLIVEDDVDAAAVLAQILRGAGIESDIAASAAAARELLEKRRYDGITLDILLPDQSGLALMADVRRQDYGRTLPIVVLSIYEPDATAQAAATAARVSDWLTKPIDSQRLLAAMRRALGLRPPSDAAATG